MKSKKITVVGSGYVGMSLAVLLSKYNAVSVFDIDKKLIANNPRLIEWMNLSEDISSWLPVNSISSNVIDYCCKVHLYEKKV